MLLPWFTQNIGKTIRVILPTAVFASSTQTSKEWSKASSAFSIRKTFSTSPSPWEHKSHVQNVWARWRNTGMRAQGSWGTGPLTLKSILSTFSRARSPALCSWASPLSPPSTPGVGSTHGYWHLELNVSPGWNSISWLHFCYYFWDLALGIWPLASGPMIRSKANPP